jgi:hypothetical protein
MYQLAHVGRTKAVHQRLIQVNARERLLQLVDKDSERGELAWRHRTHHRQARPYHEHGTLRLRGGARSAVSWNSDNAQDDALAQDEYEEHRCCSYCRGSTTSPLIARPPITSAPSEPPVGATCPATTDISTPKCPTLALMGDGASTPTATTSPANEQPGSCPSRIDRSNMTISRQGVTTSAKGR